MSSCNVHILMCSVFPNHITRVFDLFRGTRRRSGLRRRIIPCYLCLGQIMCRIQIRRRQIPKKFGKTTGEIRLTPGKNKNGIHPCAIDSYISLVAVLSYFNGIKFREISSVNSRLFSGLNFADFREFDQNLFPAKLNSIGVTHKNK